MNPTSVTSITSSAAGDFTVLHGLGRVPFAAVPVSLSAGVFRLTPMAYDASFVYLNASDAGLTGMLVLW